MHRSSFRRASLLGSIALIAGCSAGELTDDTTPATPEPPVTPQPVQSLDADQMSRRIPGFGGFYLDRAGTPTMFLTDAGSGAEATRLLSPALAARGIPTTSLRILRGDYDYRQLGLWFARGTPEVLAEPGAILIDLDESRNRVRVGIESIAAEAAVRAALARAGIPREAVIIELAEPVHLVATLRDQIRPTQGGLQIHWDQYVCTLGFNATRNGTASFITNSHCSGRQGGVQGTEFYQAVATSPGSFIGTEVDDPDYVRNAGGCPKGKKCRRSDSSRGAYAAGVTSTLGRIARTTGANNGSLTIDPANPFFTITGEDLRTSFTIGETLNKVGRTSGWTQGRVSATCVNVGVQGSSIVQLCQTQVDAGVQGGDSGSGVFGLISSNNVRLAGILWGGNSAGTRFTFSPLANIEAELGALTTF